MSPFLSDCPSLMLVIAIHCIQHSQAMLERGVCELAHSFFHCPVFKDLGITSVNSVNFSLKAFLYCPVIRSFHYCPVC